MIDVALVGCFWDVAGVQSGAAVEDRDAAGLAPPEHIRHRADANHILVEGKWLTSKVDSA